MADLGDKLIAAAEAGDVSAVQSLLSDGAEAFYQNEDDGRSALMAAASCGNLEVISALLSAGAPWNAQDRGGKCAGDYAIAGGHQEAVDALLNAGVQAELILGTLMSKEQSADASNAEYLSNRVQFHEDKILDSNQDGVMMEWETPLMQAHVDMLFQCASQNAGDRGIDVMNVGFGMGIFDSAVQKSGPRQHTIIEAHPDVHQRMVNDGWTSKDNVNVLFGRWQDKIAELPDNSFDAIFFDTYGEYYEDMQDFHPHVARLVRPGGVYSFFNGLCPGNFFFHAVACQVVQLEMSKLGFDVQFIPCEVGSDSHSQDTWDGVKRRYWWSDTYYLPLCRKL